MAMREVEFAQATNDDGLMSFRVGLPLSRAQSFGKAAADGQMGCIMKMYRDWQLSGDDKQLQLLWPKVKKAVQFCWIPGGWDADRDGIMEGCQHNTMDVEYYGPNPQMGFWYLGALAAAQAMAQHLADQDFAQQCGELLERGRDWIDRHLFNGEYYEHEIRMPQDPAQVAPSLRVGMGAKDPAKPDYQLGPGCLVDQLIGQLMAHVCDLGYLAKPENIQQTLRSILKYNRRAGLYDHFNNMRSFALGDENALLMASFPKGRPQYPFPYFPEAMTGFEYTAAIGMLYEGQIQEGLTRDCRCPCPLRWAEAQPAERGGMRPPLCPCHDRLGGRVGAVRIPLFGGYPDHDVRAAGGEPLLVQRLRVGQVCHAAPRRPVRGPLVGAPRPAAPRRIPATWIWPPCTGPYARDCRRRGNRHADRARVMRVARGEEAAS